MNPIADPYINTRNEMLARERDTRSRMQMPHASEGYPGLEGRSNMQDDYDDEEQGTTTDADLMPEINAPIDRTKLAYQESGHGVQVFEGYKGQ
jgi:hypothetical protein